ncbi:MAG: DMT family transporter [Chitinophagaceae bacterium]|jgi:drug/metabolite transporter (DMT)-like permease|nr:DMT family transporter [Chitinophagaceae bacterium]
MNEQIKAHLALLGANLFYGAGFTVAKIVMPSLIQPKGFILIRVAVVTILFWLSYFGGKNFRTKIDRKDWRTLILCAIFGVATNQLLFFQGLNLTSPIHASLMMLSTPILVSLFAVYALHEKLSVNKIIGLILGVSGAVILVLLGGKDKVATNALLGDVFVLMNATSYAIYLVIAKPLMTKYRPIIVIRWIFLLGLLVVFPFGISEFTEINWHMFSFKEYAAVAFIVICCTFFTYLWNIYALRILSPATAGAYIYLQPVFAALIAVFFYFEHLSWTKVIASIFIFAGVYFVSKRKATIAQ